jgi:hypothetical protein
MDSLVGFHVDMWDYLTFPALLIIAGALLCLVIFIQGLRGKIASTAQTTNLRLNAPDLVKLMRWPLCRRSLRVAHAFLSAFRSRAHLGLCHVGRHLVGAENRGQSAQLGLSQARLVGPWRRIGADSAICLRTSHSPARARPVAQRCAALRVAAHRRYRNGRRHSEGPRTAVLRARVLQQQARSPFSQL